MIRILHLASSFPFLKGSGPIIHVSLGLLAVIVVLLRLSRSLSLIEPDDQKRRSLMAMCFTATAISFLILPFMVSYGFSSMKAIGKGLTFQWAVTNWHQGFLACLVPLWLLIAGLCKIFRNKKNEFNGQALLDTVALHLPLGMLIIQTAFFITGNGWGRTMSLHSLGIPMKIQAPLPLYALLSNLILYYFLKHIHNRVYASSLTKLRFTGTVWGVFALVFGSGVQFLDHYSREIRIMARLTLTQILMAVFILAGIFCLTRIFFAKEEKQLPVPLDQDTAIRRLVYIAGFTAMTLMLFFIVYYMIRNMHVISWPFSKTKSLADAYLRILQYMPMMGLPAIAFLWMKRSHIPLRDAFRWKRISRWFYPALFASIGYGLYKLFGKSSLKGLEYWPPVLILSTMNALSEEYSYRFVFFRLLRKAKYSRLVSQMGQAVLYSLPHFMLAGLAFGFMSFLYGLLLGILADRNESIVPAVICHFIIDIGCIGNPLLRI